MLHSTATASQRVRAVLAELDVESMTCRVVA